MPKIGTIHIIHGYIAFGKTTLAKKLAHDLPAVYLNADEWIAKLYGHDIPEPEFNARVNIVLGFIWEFAAQIISTGTDVIMDIGPWSKQMRRDVANIAYKITPNVIFHTIILDPAIARNRLIERNKNQENLLDVTSPEYFDNNLQFYEPISDDEGFIVKRYYQDK